MELKEGEKGSVAPGFAWLKKQHPGGKESVRKSRKPTSKKRRTTAEMDRKNGAGHKNEQGSGEKKEGRQYDVFESEIFARNVQYEREAGRKSRRKRNRGSKRNRE